MNKSDHPLFEIVTTTAGVVSIRNKAVNEIMHNPVGPWVEANALYIDQSHLRERLMESTSEELIIYDVGLGAAANALAALICARGLGRGSRPMRIISFERDLELLRFALAHASHFAHFHGNEEILEEILDKRHWQQGGLAWELRRGNFLEVIDQETFRPHLVFFDPYSPKMNEEMWTTSCFTKIRKKSREPSDGGTSLFTYSRATRIRVALIKAGFFVGYGTATGLKDETTQAATGVQLLKSPLGKIWFERWEKSHLRYPSDCLEGQRDEFDQCVRDYMALMGVGPWCKMMD